MKNMNLPNKTNGMAGENTIAPVTSGFFRQMREHGIICARLKMQLIRRAGNLAFFFTVVALCLMLNQASAQTNVYSTNGTEYAFVGAIPGDQVSPDVSVSTNGGYLVWADNATDGDNWGISARKLDATLSGTLSSFRVNVNGVGAQENPHVARLQNGGAVFVWQGGKPGFPHIYARFMNSSGIFIGTTDTLVNSSTNYYQLEPSVTVLNNGNVIVVWSSYDQAGVGSMQDVYGQMFASDGTKLGSEFLVNQFTTYNQRSAAIAAQPNGGFIVAWVTEQQRLLAPNTSSNSLTVSYSSMPRPSVDIYARYFNSAATPLAAEFLVNADSNPCSAPSLKVATDGSFLVVWCARDMANQLNSLDIRGRTYNSSGTAGAVFYVNSTLYGDQYLPKVSSIGLDYFVTWTSLGQDGSREGVFGRLIHNNGVYNSGEFLVNTTTAGQQMNAAVTSDGSSQFLVVWRSFNNLANGFDLYVQRYLNMQIGLPAMSPPIVWAPFVVSNNVYQPQLMVSWAPQLGLSISNYEVYVDGSSIAATNITTNVWVMKANNVPSIPLTANSTHSFRIDYVTPDGRRPPLSPSSSGTTWGGGNWGGIPYEWMAQYFGGYYGGIYHTNAWWPASLLLDSGHMTLYRVYLSGGDPFDPTTWLRLNTTRTVQGMSINWNTMPGALYQVQQSTNLKTYSNFGAPRFAAGTNDSINVSGSTGGYYQVILLR